MATAQVSIPTIHQALALTAQLRVALEAIPLDLFGPNETALDIYGGHLREIEDSLRREERVAVAARDAHAQ